MNSDPTLKQEPASERVLILAPTAMDSTLSANVLGEANIVHHVCKSLPELCEQIERGAGVAMIAEEYLIADERDRIVSVLSRQPDWSDFPLIVLLSPVAHSSELLGHLQTLGNVTLLARPIRMAMFVLTIEAKLRDRRRQYAVRDLLIQQTKASRSMRRSERRLSQALMAGQMAVWEWRQDRVFWSDQFYKLLGVPRKITASLDAFYQVVHPDDQRILREAWEDAVDGIAPYHEEFRIRRPNGEIRWLATVGEPSFDSAHRVVLFAGLCWDITERKTTELRLQRFAETERFLSDASLALSSSLDYDDTLATTTRLCIEKYADWAFIDLLQADNTVRRVKVAHANPAHAELAAKVAQFPAKPQILDHPPARGVFGGKGFIIEDFTESMLRAAAQSAEHEQVMRAVAPRSFAVVPLVARGERLGALTMIVSESGRSYTQHDLRVAEELSRRASLALDNARLYEIGQQASAAKSVFVANMSHEIRSPMTAILGYADLLINKERDPKKLDSLRTIKRNGEFLLDIINDILDLSKIEANKMDIVRERVAINQLVDDVRMLMELRASEKGLRLDVHYADDLPHWIESDPKRLRQILINLIGNAIKFTESGTVTVRTTVVKDDAQQKIRFDVIDTGVGMNPDQLSRLFQPFSQGDSSVSRSYGGTGLGLAISQRLASMLGGQISVVSSPQQGSTFSCLVDAGQVHDQPPVQSDLRPRGDPANAERPQIQLNCRVLVVDDRRDVRFLTRHLLLESGANVDDVADGIQAIERIRATMNSGKQFDLILLDMQMPNMDGYQTAGKLREMGCRQPIIALTADAMHGDMDRCLRNGCDAYLSKPINARELIDTVFRYTNPR